jgi:uncharacterized protein (TIGR02246 family)
MRKLVLATLALSILAALPASANDGAKLLDDAFAKAFKLNDVNAVAGLYAKDAVLYPADGPAVQGSDAIRAYFKALLARYHVMDYDLSDTHYYSIGRLSVGWGRWSMSLEPKDGGDTVTTEGRFTSIARNDNGYWFYIVEHFSLKPRPQGSQAAQPPQQP